MLQHVYERVSLARYLTHVIIATDDERIAQEGRRIGAPVRMTRPDHLSGTDRVAEVASMDPAEWVVNVQGDEPLIDPGAIDAAILPLLDDPSIPMGTLKKRIEDPREIEDPNVVKVVTDRVGNAIYFSRSTIPYVRDEAKDKGQKAKGKFGRGCCWRSLLPASPGRRRMTGRSLTRSGGIFGS
jgi:3-deoxy-manno-octulosonate cytidylyltransferase (CMP-KDO synthetase)